MPCRDWEYASDCQYTQGQYDEVRNKLDKVTQFLCYMCGENEINNDGILPKEIQKWWDEHQKNDNFRVYAEMLSTIRHSKHSVSSLANRFICSAEKVHPVSDFHKKWFNDLAQKAFSEHEKEKSEKENAENKKKKLLKKLTKEEKELLGIRE